MGDPLRTKEMESYNERVREISFLPTTSPSFVEEEQMYNLQAVQTKKEREEKRRIQEQESEILGGIWDYMKYDTAPGALVIGLQEILSSDYDPDFDPYTYDNFKPKDKWENDQIGDATNPEHYALIKERLEDHRLYEENLQSMGYGQFGIMAAGELLNLTNYVLPGSGAFKTMAGIKRVAASAALQASVNTLELSAIDAVFQDRSATEYLSTAAMGMAFGGLFGGIMGTKNVDGIKSTSEVIDQKAKFYADLHMTTKAKETTASAESVGAAKLQADPKILDPEMETRLREQHIDVNDPLAVAATVDAAEGLLERAGKLIGGVFVSQGGKLLSAKNVLMRKIGFDLAETPEALISKGIDKQTASLEVAMETNRVASLYAKRTDDLYMQFQKVEKDFKGVTNWNDLAFERIHRGEDLDRLSPEGNKILREWGENRQVVWDDLARKAHAAGVEEFDDLDKVLDHVTRPYDPANIHRLTGEHGEEAMVQLFQKALTGDGGFEKIYQKYVDQAVKKAEEFKTGTGQKQIAKLESEITELKNTMKDKKLPDLKRADAEAGVMGRQKKIDALKAKGEKWTEFTGKGIDVKKISYEMAKQTLARMMRRATSPTRDANLLNTGNQTLMRKVINDSDMDQTVKDALLHIMSTQGRDVTGKLGAPRMHIDMGAEVVSPVTGKPVRITEFFNTDTGAGQFQHMRYWIGRTAMANQGDQYKSIKALDKNEDAIKYHGDSIGMNADDVTNDLTTYRSLVTQLLGQPLEDLSGKSIKASRNVRKMVQLNVLNKVGVPQLGESGRALAAVGNLIQGIPMLGKFLTDIRGNRLSPEIVRNMEDHLFGKIGDDYIMNSSMFRGEDLGTKAGMIETGLNKLGYTQGLLSGWHFIHTAQRKFLVNGLSQKYFNDITRGTMSQVQMNNLGIAPQLLSRIKDNMLKNATDVTKSWGRHIPKNLHIEKWEPDVAQAFGQAVYRKSNNAIQGILIGEIPEFMTKEVGKVLTQFRTFNIASVGKQTRRDIQLAKAGEMEPYNAMMFQFATAVMAVSLKIGWDATTSGDRDAYLDDHLTVKEIARQAMVYNGQVGWGFDIVDTAGSVVLPDAWNPLMSRQGYESSGGIERVVPGLNYLNKVKDGIKGTSNIITGQSDDYKADARAALGWLPLENSIAADFILTPIQN